jgi:hypothetical protein
MCHLQVFIPCACLLPTWIRMPGIVKFSACLITETENSFYEGLIERVTCRDFNGKSTSRASLKDPI